MTAKRKRPKVRFVALRMKLASGDFNFAIHRSDKDWGDEIASAVALYATKRDARRIAAALNWHTAFRKGEL